MMGSSNFNLLSLTPHLTRSTPSTRMADDDTIDIGEDILPKKRKTTYNREHPTQNPKPPKRSKAEVQAEAAEKKAATKAKKNEKANLHAAAEIQKQETRRISLKGVAAVEDAIQRQQRQHQLQAERPDLQTMETYRTIQEALTVTTRNASTASRPATEETEEDHTDHDAEMPPQSNIDTDSDGGLLGVEDINFEGEDEGEGEGEDDDAYMPAVDEDNDLDEEEEKAFSDASVEEEETSKRNGTKMQKVRIPLIS